MSGRRSALDLRFSHFLCEPGQPAWLVKEIVWLS